MTQVEHYWPPEMLAEVFPEKYGHLILKWPPEEQPLPASRHTVERLPGGCVVIGLPGGQAAWRAAHRPDTSSRGKPTP